VRYYPNSSPLFPVQGRRYVLAAVISVGEDKLPRRRTSQASRVSDPLERGTWSLRGACGLDRIRPYRVYDVSVVQPAGISTDFDEIRPLRDLRLTPNIKNIDVGRHQIVILHQIGVDVMSNNVAQRLTRQRLTVHQQCTNNAKDIIVPCCKVKRTLRVDVSRRVASFALLSSRLPPQTRPLQARKQTDGRADWR
jgi:hypothetical protein